MPKQNTEKNPVFLIVFPREKPVSLAIKILAQVSEVISRHFVLQVGFSKEQNKTHLKTDITSFEQNKCYIFPVLFLYAISVLFFCITMKIYGIKLDKYYATKSNSRHQFDWKYTLRAMFLRFSPSYSVFKSPFFARIL